MSGLAARRGFHLEQPGLRPGRTGFKPGHHGSGGPEAVADATSSAGASGLAGLLKSLAGAAKGCSGFGGDMIVESRSWKGQNPASFCSWQELVFPQKR